MYSEPRKIVFTGLVVGAVAIGVGAYVSHSDEEWLPSDDLGATHGGGGREPAHGNMISGVVRSAPLEGRSDSATERANSLKAARNSLLRDDVAAARAELNAISPGHRDDQQVLALQKEIQARADREQHAAAAAQIEKTPEPMPTPSRTSPISSATAAHSRDTQLASREYSNRAAAYPRNRRNVTTVVAKSGAAGTHAAAVGASTVPGRAAYAPADVTVARATGASAAVTSLPLLQQAVPGAGEPSMQPAMQASTQPATRPSTQPSMQQAAAEPAPAARSTPASPPTATTAQQAVLPPPLVAQTSIPSAPLPKSDGPKTRAQVRAEIARARADGSLPAFGNPDPAGPGGAPSLTIAPRP